MRYIDGRLADPDLNPRAVAAAMHVSLRTLQRAFTNEQTSIMGYVRDRRLDRARADLMSTSMTVAQVAARWQFSDSSHFIRAHKKRYYEPPGARRGPTP